MTKMYKHPDTREIRVVDEKNAVQVAAVEKLGYVELTAEDVTSEEKPTVTYETVTDPHVPPAPPALPKLTKAVPSGPTKDTK